MARPKLLLMDEPSMGLAPILVERSFEIIKEVHDAGVAILVVEQNANVSLSIAGPRLRFVHGSRGARRKGPRLAGKRGTTEGVPWPLNLASPGRRRLRAGGAGPRRRLASLAALCRTPRAPTHCDVLRRLPARRQETEDAVAQWS